jgi:long-chain acyl-CoA synthetase
VPAEEITLPDALVRSASRFPDHTALLFQGYEITYGELNTMVSQFANGLYKIGIRKGSKVSVMLPNLVQMVVAMYGAMRAGATIVTHNPLAPDMTVQRQLNDAQTEILICLDLLVPRMLKIRGRTEVKKIVSCHINDYLPYLKKRLFPLVKGEMYLKTPEDPDVIEFTELMESTQSTAHLPKTNFREIAAILYTSATTGMSKGVDLSHRNLATNVSQIKSWFPSFMDGQEVVVGCLPFFHSFGLTCALNISIIHGYSIILIPKPDPKAILEGAHGYGATFMPALPTMYIGMLGVSNIAKYDLTNLKGCFSGGAPLPLETIKEFKKLTHLDICEGYGLTETSPATHINPYGGVTKPGAIGVPLPSVEAKLVSVSDFSNEVREYGAPGELCVKGPQVMMGYHNSPEQTDAVIKDGWFLTGDVATMDKQGYFYIVDRKSDIIYSQGAPVYPREIEETLFANQKVYDACAVGIKAGDRGETVVAFVVLKQGETATPEDIQSYCRVRLDTHKVPTEVVFLDDLPRSPVGKTLRKEVKRLHLIKKGQVKPQT